MINDFGLRPSEAAAYKMHDYYVYVYTETQNFPSLWYLTKQEGMPDGKERFNLSKQIFAQGRVTSTRFEQFHQRLKIALPS